MNLYTIRHGETNMGENKVIATEEEPLNHTGKQQAIHMGKELNKLELDFIYCSPIERAKHTSQNILLVTHGGIMRAIYWYFNGIDSSLFTCENCKIYPYTFLY